MKSPHRGATGLAFVTSLTISACTLVVDVEELEDRECPSGRKLCKDACVSVDDPCEEGE